MNVVDQSEGDNWKMYLGDSCEIIKEIPDNAVHFIMFSPPFSSLYTYSNSERDMGNCKNDSEFMEHFKYLSNDLFRILKNGRVMCVHCMDLPAMKYKDGYIGLKDFPGTLIRIFEDSGFIYHSRVTIWKDPAIEAQRTKAIGLAKKQFVKDSIMCRVALPDYVIVMRKPGENSEPIPHPEENWPEELWEYCADPIWFDPVWVNIRPSHTLQKIREKGKDEKHIAPLQLTVVERCVNLYTNPNDIVFTPFAGIGTEVYVALQNNRKGIGIELKREYYDQAILNLKSVFPSETKPKQSSLFSFGE